MPAATRPAGWPATEPADRPRAARSAAQDLRTSGDPAQGNGAITRVDPNTGNALPDNPLVGNGIPSDDRHIAYGLRNPYRFTFRPGTNELWVADVGWNTWEEIDRIANPTDSTIENFGWPCYEGVGRQPAWDNLNVNICENLYAAGASAVTAPYFTYSHNAPPDAARCTTGGGAITGIAFGGPPYPVQYHGALFFADYVKKCLWAMMPGANGLPDSTNIRTIATGVTPVDIEAAPDGRLYYVDIALGTVNRLDGFGTGNQPPIASFTATPPYGATPLAVTFDASATTDDGPLSSLTYKWDLDGDGQYDDATGVTASRTYSASANVKVGLLVTDGLSATGATSFVVEPGNTPPTATITAPAATPNWAAGDTVNYSGTASDPQETLGPTSMKWSVSLHHCFAIDQCHEHPQGTFVGAGGSFVAPEHEYPAYLTFTLTVTDSRGLTDTKSVRVDPKTIDVTFKTQPSGMQLTIGSGVVTTPATITAIQGSRISVTANSPQFFGNTSYVFSRGPTAARSATTSPRLPAGLTYTASYVPGGPGTALLVVGGSPTALGAGDSAVRPGSRRSASASSSSATLQARLPTRPASSWSRSVRRSWRPTSARSSDR